MTEWITGRAPGELDADSSGRVAIKTRVDSDCCVTIDWELVPPGMAWAHTPQWRQLAKLLGFAEPVQPTKPALAAGQRWRRRDGEVVTVAKYSPAEGSHYPFLVAGSWSDPNGGAWYNVDGISCIGIPDCDLVELIQE